MGFIKQVLNGVFSFLVGIFGGLAKLVGLGKKSEYFLEADPVDQAVVSSASQSGVAAKASTANGQSVLPEAAIASSATLIAVEKGASNGSATATAKKSKVSKKALKAEAAEAAKAEAAESANAATPVAVAPVDVTFAPNYLMTANSRSGRRRPGPSMNQFRDMARQVNSQN